MDCKEEDLCNDFGRKNLKPNIAPMVSSEIQELNYFTIFEEIIEKKHRNNKLSTIVDKPAAANPKPIYESQQHHTNKVKQIFKITKVKRGQ